MSLPFYKIALEKVFIGLRPLGQDTVIGGRYIKKYGGTGERERKRAELHSYQKEKAVQEANKYCTTCGSLATLMALYQSEGATIRERYCQACIDANKHLLTDNEETSRYDNLFIKAEPDSEIYKQAHARRPKE